MVGIASSCCPLCNETLKRVPFSLDKDISLCPNEECVYPYNLEKFESCLSPNTKAAGKIERVLTSHYNAASAHEIAGKYAPYLREPYFSGLANSAQAYADGLPHDGSAGKGPERSSSQLPMKLKGPEKSSSIKLPSFVPKKRVSS